MSGCKDEVNDKALIKAGAGIFKVLENMRLQVNKTLRLQDAYQGKSKFEGYELEGEIIALEAIAAACNGTNNSIYAELLKVASFAHELRKEVDKAKRRQQSAKKVKQERRKAARARKSRRADRRAEGSRGIVEISKRR